MLLNSLLLLAQNVVDSIANDSTKLISTNNDPLIALLKEMSLEDLVTKLVELSITFGLKIIMSIIIFYIGKFLIGRLYSVLSNVLVRKEIEASLSSFLLSLLRIVLLFLLVVTIVGILGIETSSFVAIFASAGVAIGLALSGTLQNFAGGVLILLTKPYRVGDYIEFGSYTGTVKEIQIFSTILNTSDNKTIIVPNGGLSTGSVTNYSSELYRRISWTFTISYGDDVNVARQAILDILTKDDRIVKSSCEDDYENRPQSRTDKLSGIIPTIPVGDKSPRVYLGELAADSVNLTVRAWVYTPFYWDVFFDVNEKVYNQLPQKGLNFPFPQLDVHLNNTNV